MSDTSAPNAIPPPTQRPYTQRPHDHLPYGPEREAIILENLTQSHFEHINELFDRQSNLARSTIAEIRTSHKQTLDQLYTFHKQTVDHLLAQIQAHRLWIDIFNWRQEVLDNEADRSTNPAADLMQKYADLRAAPLSALAGVKAAESASEPGLDTDMDPPVSTVLGIEGARGGAATAAGRLYGAEEDVAVVLGGEAAVDAGVTSGAGAGAGDGAIGPAAAADVEEAAGGEETGVGDGAAVAAVAADAGCTAAVTAKPRRRLLGKLKKIFKI